MRREQRLSRLMIAGLVLWGGGTSIAGQTHEARTREAWRGEHLDMRTPEGWTPEAHLDVATVQETAFSPDGARVAFVVRSAVMSVDPPVFRTRIWLASTDGSWSRVLTSAEHSSSAPSFSADGGRLAFLSDRSGGTQVWMLSLDGGDARQLTRAAQGVVRFRWSPEQSRLVYAAPDPASPSRDSPRQGPSTLRRASANALNSHLFMLDVDPDSHEIPESVQITWGDVHSGDFDWAPSGRRIAVTRLPDPLANTPFVQSDLRLLSLPPGRGVRRGLVLTALGGTERGPRWSPDGRWIAFSGTGRRPEPIGRGDIYVVSTDRGEPRRLASTPDRGGSPPIGWTPDGSAVLVAEPSGTSVHVMAVPLDGSAPRRITTTEGFRAGFSTSPAGLIAYGLENPEVPPEVYVLDPSTGRETRVSDLNPEVAARSMASTRIVDWSSADGLRIEGLLTRPPDAVEGRPLPLVVVLHGGPGAVAARAFTGRPETVMIQGMARRGFAVLRPNPRGSFGYGPDFRYALVGALGEDDADDVSSGVVEMIRAGVAHPDSLVVVGSGYGGYLAVRLAARSDRFRAASVIAPLTDLGMLALTTDIPAYLTAFLGVEPWEDPAVYLRHSVIAELSRINTPFQIVHGASTARIPGEQSRALHGALARLDVDTELLMQVGGADGPHRLLELQHAVYGWLEAHLRPPAAVAAPERPPQQPRRTRFIASEYEPYGRPGTGVIEGRAFIVLPDGTRKYCAHETVFMNPVTTHSTEWYERNVIDREELEPIPPTGYHWITRSDGSGRFRFVDLPPGDYYLGCRAVPEEGFAYARVSLAEGARAVTSLVRFVLLDGAVRTPTPVPPEAAHWTQLDGVWTCVVRTPGADGVVRESRSIWTWETILGGRGIRDTYLGVDDTGDPRFRGDAIRVWDATRNRWEITWADDASPGTRSYHATSSPDRIVMSKVEPDPEWRTEFYDIAPTSFDWRSEPSGGRMRCERESG